jgi:vacuolar-type H+-ATPase subunit F/Vma7
MTGMGGVAVIGEEPLVRGFGLAGALVLPAADAPAARAAWAALPDDVAVVILTAAAAAALDTGIDWPLTVAMR